MKNIALLLLLLIILTPLAAMADPSDPWYNASWGYRVAVTVDDAQVDADLTDFPVYVDLSTLPAGFHTNVKSDGSDIRVTTSDGTNEVPREVVVYDAATDTGELHFKAPTVANSTDTEFYIYYGNAAASDYARGDTYGTENVWNSNYRAVYHLQEDGNTTAGGYLDSTANDRHATGVAVTNSTDVAGKLGTSQNFNGSSQYISLPSGTIDLASATSEVSIEAWINADSAGDKNEPIVTARSSTTELPIFALLLGANGANNANTGFLTTIVRDNPGAGLQNIIISSQNLNDDAWNMVHVTRNSSKLKTLYRNGVSGATGTDAMLNPSTFNIIAIGAERRWISDNFTPSGTSAAARYFDGEIDEVRILGVALTAAWIDAEYANQNTPTTFYAVGSQETPPAAASTLPILLRYGTMLLNKGMLIFN